MVTAICDPNGVSPLYGVNRYKIGKRQRLLEPEEKAKLGAAIAAAGARGANLEAIAVLRLLALTGARKAELLKLEWSSINFDKGVISLPDSKGGQQKIRLGAPALDLLRKLKLKLKLKSDRVVGSSYVFPYQAARPKGSRLNRTWEKVREETEI